MVDGILKVKQTFTQDFEPYSKQGDLCQICAAGTSGPCISRITNMCADKVDDGEGNVACSLDMIQCSGFTESPSPSPSQRLLCSGCIGIAWVLQRF